MSDDERDPRDEGQEAERRNDDLELPDETAEQVTGGQFKPDKLAPPRFK